MVGQKGRYNDSKRESDRRSGGEVTKSGWLTLPQVGLLHQRSKGTTASRKDIFLLWRSLPVRSRLRSSSRLGSARLLPLPLPLPPPSSSSLCSSARDVYVNIRLISDVIYLRGASLTEAATELSSSRSLKTGERRVIGVYAGYLAGRREA